MPTLLPFMSRVNATLGQVEHAKKFYNLGPYWRGVSMDASIMLLHICVKNITGTVVPIKGDSDEIFFLQLVSKT